MIYQDEGPKSLELPGAWPGLFAFGLVLLQGALFALAFGPDLAGPLFLDSPPAQALPLRLLAAAAPALWLWRARGLRRPRRAVRAATLGLAIALLLPLWPGDWPGRLAIACYWPSLALAIEVHFWPQPWPKGTRGWRGLARSLCRGAAVLAAALALGGQAATPAGRLLAGATLALAVLSIVLSIVLAWRRPKASERQLCPRCGVLNHVPPGLPIGCHDCGLVLRHGQKPQFLVDSRS
jgi:hypothetical protein